MAKSDDKLKEGASSTTGGTAPTESPPAEGGSATKDTSPPAAKPAAKAKGEAMVEAVFLKRHVLAGPAYPGGCHTFYPAREQKYRKHRGGPLLKRTIPADRWRFTKKDFDHLHKQGIVARAGGDA